MPSSYTGRHVTESNIAKIVGQVMFEIKKDDLFPDVPLEQVEALMQSGASIASVVASKSMLGYLAALGSGDPLFYSVFMTLLVQFEEALDDTYESVLRMAKDEMDMDSKPE